ncbi:MAG: vWA domain-containing protein [Bacteroidota bacterium]
MDLSLGYSPLLLVACLFAAAGLTWWTYGRSVPRLAPGRRAVLMALRGAALFVVLLLLFEPVLRQVEATEEPPVLAVLVDGSQSLGREDGAGDGAATARDALRRIPDVDGETRVYSFDAEASPLDARDSLRFDGVRTDIAGALSRVEADLDGQNLGGVLLISDGRYNTGRNPLYLAERYDVPIYTATVGDTTQQRDVLVARVTTNEIAYAGVELPVQVAVRADGFGGERATVSLFERGERLASQQVTLPEGGVEATVDLSLVPEAEGLRRYTIAVTRFDGEVTYGNNTEAVAVRVLSNRRRVLLLAAAPGPDLAALRQVLATDPNLEVVPRTQRSPGTFYEGRLPTLEGFDAVLLAGWPGRAADRATAQRVAAAAGAGVPLLFLLTRQTDLPSLRSTFGDALPAIPEVVRTTFTEAALVPTAAGALHPVLQVPAVPPGLLDRLPPVALSDSRWAAAPDARVLATVRVRGVPLGDPMLLVRQRGRARSAALLAAGTWRWQNVPADLDAVAGFYPGLVENLLRWLTTREDDRPVRVRPVRSLFGEGEAVQFTGQVYDESLAPIPDASVQVRITAPDGTTSPFAMRAVGSGRYTLDAGTLPEGDYTFRAEAERAGAALGTDRGAFAVGALALEFRDTQADAALMRGLARRSGGTVIDPADLDELPARLAAGGFGPRLVEEERETELWHLAWLLAVVIALLAAEWVLRKRSGMV